MVQLVEGAGRLRRRGRERRAVLPGLPCRPRWRSEDPPVPANCVRLARRLHETIGTPSRPRRRSGSQRWVLPPIDLVPEFLPVIGPLDDVIVVALDSATSPGRCRRRPCWRHGMAIHAPFDRLLGTSSR